jgi:tellurite resistance protein
VSQSRSSVARIPLGTLGIPLGLAGLAGAWGAISEYLGVPRAYSEVVWIAAAVSWVWLIVAHTVRGAQSSERLIDQLRHPAQGPLDALVPVVGMLLGAHLHVYWVAGGVVLTVASIVAAALYGGWMLSFWLSGNLKLESVHGGYFVPLVSAGLVAAIAAEAIGLVPLAIASLAVGVFFWVVVFTLLLARMAFRSQLPAPLLPSLAIIVAPPAVAGMGWFALSGEVGGPVGLSLAGLTAVFALLQLALLPRFLKLPFSLGFWSFTFPYAATVSYAADWLNATRPAGWEAITVALVSVVTLFILTIAARSIILVARARRVLRIAARQASASQPSASSVVTGPVTSGVPTLQAA